MCVRVLRAWASWRRLDPLNKPPLINTFLGLLLTSLIAQAGGALVGPAALGLIQDVESIRHLAELGVVFLLFNIGLELSFDRLRSMGKFVFGMGTAQVGESA